jgi:hypothetical protein
MDCEYLSTIKRSAQTRNDSSWHQLLVHVTNTDIAIHHESSIESDVKRIWNINRPLEQLIWQSWSLLGASADENSSNATRFKVIQYTNDRLLLFSKECHMSCLTDQLGNLLTIAQSSPEIRSSGNRNENCVKTN